jgi:hypothetical protein
LRRTWLRYMPLMPATASAHIRTLKQSRMKTSVVVTVVRFSWGWPIWTPMKIAPAPAAATPAARVRLVVVTVIAGSWSSVSHRAGCPAMSMTVGIGGVSGHHQVM